MPAEWKRVPFAEELGELGGVNLANTPPTDIAPGTAAVGTGETAARNDHVHGYVEPDVPDPGTGATDIDGEAAAGGSAVEYAREDHAHGFAPIVALDFNQQEIQRAVIHNTATAPATPVEGQIYFNGTHLYVFANTD